jgi:hypothetical protein
MVTTPRDVVVRTFKSMQVDLDCGKLDEEALLIRDVFEIEQLQTYPDLNQIKNISDSSKITPLHITEVINSVFDELPQSPQETDAQAVIGASMVYLATYLNDKLEAISVADRNVLADKLSKLRKVFNAEKDDSFKSIGNLEDDIRSSVSPKRSLPPEVLIPAGKWRDDKIWGSKTDNIGTRGSSLPPEILKKNPQLKDYEYFSVNNDGSCWTRSAWQSIFEQILNDPKAFSDFISKTKELRNQFANDLQFFRNNSVGDVIDILDVLKSSTIEQRENMVNHRSVDWVLNNFMRKVSAASLRLEDTERTKESQTYINRIEQPCTFGGALELNAFARCYDLQIAEVALIGDSNIQLSFYGQQDQTKTQTIAEKLSGVIMYGSSPGHYEFLKKSNF